MADLAAAAGKLRAFVHLSTAYVNCDRPHGSHVEETLYPFDLSACRPRGGIFHSVLAQGLEAGGCSMLA